MARWTMRTPKDPPEYESDQGTLGRARTEVDEPDTAESACDEDPGQMTKILAK
jgi:hypothetical protein